MYFLGGDSEIEPSDPDSDTDTDEEDPEWVDVQPDAINVEEFMQESGPDAKEYGRATF